MKHSSASVGGVAGVGGGLSAILALFVVLAILVVGWWMTVVMAADFYRADGGSAASAAAAEWNRASLGALLFMWAVMMTAMMLPSALPAARLFWRWAASSLSAGGETGAALRGVQFVAGYLLAWGVFSAAAAVLQQQAAAAAMLNDALALHSPFLRAAVLIAAGLFQMTPMKHVCLKACRHPAWFFMLHWRGGRFGALRMGVHHGAFCVGCCWALMLLLFVGGVMNLAWIIALTLYVIVEKVWTAAPRGLSVGVGVILIINGIINILEGI